MCPAFAANSTEETYIHNGHGHPYFCLIFDLPSLSFINRLNLQVSTLVLEMATKYGFIGTVTTMLHEHEVHTNSMKGLGSMGFGMCTNIHAKINPDDQLFICDINQAALERFLQESKGQAKVTILPTPKDVAEQCVSRTIPTTMSSSDQLIQGHHHNNATPKRTRATSLLRRRQQPALRPPIRINARNETLPRMQHHRPSSNARSGQ